MRTNILQAKKALLVLFALLPLVASAQTKVEIDGIWYNLTSETLQAEVTSGGSYSGSIALTATVTHNGVAYSVTSIGESAFNRCHKLTTITIPESVTSIGNYAFDGCSSLTAINIPEGVTSIGGRAFGGTAWYNNLPDGVVYIGKVLYEYKGTMPANSSIEVREGTVSISPYAFDGCSSLKSITIPEGVTSIGEYTFYNCSSLTAITIPEGVTSIERAAFSGCSSLKSITIPEGVTSIGNYAFAYCSSLTKINIPEGVTSIGSYAFDECSSLKSITIPEGVTSISDWAFYNCSSLKTVINYSDLSLERGSSDNGYVAYYADRVINIDDVIDGYAFKTKNGVHYLTGYIGDDTALTLPTDFKGENYQIGERAFYNCSGLTAITLPEGVTSIGYYAFRYCSSLKTVINYSDLSLVRGSSSYGYVAYYADRVINIDEVIDGYAFKTKNGVHYLTGYIGDDTALTLPADYKGENYQIGERAFYNCSSLTAITIPEGVTSIGNYAFYNCSSLTSIALPEGVTSIGEYTFYNCSSLKSITIPEGVTSIGSYAFYNCSSLKELTLGKELKKIASGAFAGYTALEKVTIYATRPPSIEGTGNAFFSDATYENATLYVPQGCIDKYQVVTGWSSFYTIEEMEGGSPNYLTLRQADNGEVGIVVEPGRTYKVRITAFEGWKIHSVTFNDTDVTTQLTAEGIYTTPALQADAVLNIAYEKIGTPTMVANARASRIKVQGHRGTLRVTGTTEGDDISIYTLDGTMVASEEATDDTTSIEVPTQQVYIVKVADTVVKIGM